ncbi:hypothetical protein [Ruficoccus sp. ZRK36]|uniref:sodium:solute symporter family protein n=1 Tax=Ruficoccus sp. ZRK36 TaxID=2866311 RepID=UPI001C738562|nr:hypothetical protein [Ruficoccus sp. ZRK36]QYY37465.1 hypothetical protein K0V07_08245 [Ruficoccus sp. ZRK36]
MNIEYITLSLYLGVLLLLGMVFARFNKDLSDFVRGGGRGTWWLVGTSILMSGISAFTFTGNASAAYEAGPSLLVLYLANCAGFAVGGLFLGPWFRQTRAYTTVDVIRMRFGISVEQFSAIAGVFLGPFGAAIQLYALSLFASTVLNLPLVPVMITICLIVVFYSTTGGKWAVMATDFVQALVMFAITALVFFLSLRAIGGFGEFFSYFSDPRFAEDFRFFNDPGHFSGDRFTYKWAIVIFFMQLYSQISLSSAGRYISARDGKEAARASWWAFIMMAIGSLIWFVPPMVARFMFADEIMASAVEKPTETAYAFIAMKLLPNGMMGMMIAAMFAATMSSMDSGLNGQVGVIARNMIPRLRGALGYHKELSPKTDIRICHISTLILGLIIVSYALLLANQSEIALFDAYLIIGSVIGVPMGFPKLMGLWLKKLPKWSYFPIFGGCMIPSIWSFIDGYLSGEQWTVQERTMWILICGTLATIVCRLMNRTSSEKSREEIDNFFKMMHKPIDYEKEIGSSTIDYAQYYLLGKSVMAVGALIMLILLVPNDLFSRLCILAVSLFVILSGLLLYLGGLRAQKNVEAIMAAREASEKEEPEHVGNLNQAATGSDQA